MNGGSPTRPRPPRARAVGGNTRDCCWAAWKVLDLLSGAEKLRGGVESTGPQRETEEVCLGSGVEEGQIWQKDGEES